jgi:FkbM family methyltransferase
MTGIRGPLARAASAARWILSHPMETLRLTSALERRDGWIVADHLDAGISRDVALKLMVNGGVSELSFARDGLQWRTDLGDDIGRSLWLVGAYQGDEVAAVLRWLRAAGRTTGAVIDVGANIGTTSVPFARAGYRVVAVEPVPQTFDMLTANVAENGLADLVVLLNCAIGMSVGEVQMWRGFGSGQAEVAVDGQEPSMTRWGPKGELVTVPSMPLGRVVADAGLSASDLALVWSDVQGSEREVILSSLDLWAGGVPLYLEVDPASLQLHGGLDAFIEAVAQHFTRFLSRDDLQAGRAPDRIEAFRRWVELIPSRSPLSQSSDALLIP